MLTQRQEKLLRKLRSRHGRKKSEAVLVEGRICCREALQRCPGNLLFTLCSHSFAATSEFVEYTDLTKAAGRSAEIVSDAEFARFAATENPQGVLCVLQIKPQLPDDSDKPLRDPFILILDRMAEPGNVGTILRTAWAAGLREVWLTEGSTDPFSPKCIRSGMGAQFALDICWRRSLVEAKSILMKGGYEKLWLAEPSAEVSCFSAKFDLKHAGLAVGNEAHGFQGSELGVGVTIPMPGHAESLNAAQAAGILIFEGVRRGLFGITDA